MGVGRLPGSQGHRSQRGLGPRWRLRLRDSGRPGSSQGPGHVPQLPKVSPRARCPPRRPPSQVDPPFHLAQKLDLVSSALSCVFPLPPIAPSPDRKDSASLYLQVRPPAPASLGVASGEEPCALSVRRVPCGGSLSGGSRLPRQQLLRPAPHPVSGTVGQSNEKTGVWNTQQWVRALRRSERTLPWVSPNSSSGRGPRGAVLVREDPQCQPFPLRPSFGWALVRPTVRSRKMGCGGRAGPAPNVFALSEGMGAAVAVGPPNPTCPDSPDHPGLRRHVTSPPDGPSGP